MEMTLKQTIGLMTSANYKDRMVAEYAQVKIRYENLKELNNKIELERYGIAMGAHHDTPFDLLRDQQSAMGQYLHFLEMRAMIEGIDLSGVK